MKVKALLVTGSVLGTAFLCALGYAEDRRPQRPAPPAFQRHAPGPRPGGPQGRPHQVRVLAPSRVDHGNTGFAHWNHPDFARPNYYWDWGHVHTITCTAEDSYGDQYPVSEAAPPGFGQNDMTGVEDDALDRCYQESGQDASCYLATCSHI